MLFGLFSINNYACADPDTSIAVSQAAEATGFESVWTGEHVVLPDPQVPPSPVAPQVPMLDPVVALAFIAANTTTLLLGTGIIILPQRNPVVLAKELASLDVLSKGRLLFGVGVGYLEPEFRAIGVSLRDRGARTIEYLDAMRSLWDDATPSYAGQYVAFSGVDAYPRPVQRPTPPIHMGGRSDGAYKRTVTHGHGWYGFNLTIDQTREAISGLASAKARFERPASLGDIEVSVTPRGPVDADAVRQFAELGVHRLILLPPGSADRSGLLDFVEKAGTSLITRAA